MKVLVRSVLFLLGTTGLVFGDGSIQSELSRLERSLARGTIGVEERGSLAEIYFLISRCDDARKIKGASSRVLCVCGGKCETRTQLAQVAHFRGLFEKGVRWNDGRVRALWRTLENSPEARYWAVKWLRHSGDQRVVPLRLDLERSLESLEVHPTEQ